MPVECRIIEQGACPLWNLRITNADSDIAAVFDGLSGLYEDKEIVKI